MSTPTNDAVGRRHTFREEPTNAAKHTPFPCFKPDISRAKSADTAGLPSTATTLTGATGGLAEPEVEHPFVGPIPRQGGIVHATLCVALGDTRRVETAGGSGVLDAPRSRGRDQEPGAAPG
jgi:hypothetical protein